MITRQAAGPCSDSDVIEGVTGLTAPVHVASSGPAVIRAAGSVAPRIVPSAGAIVVDQDKSKLIPVGRLHRPGECAHETDGPEKALGRWYRPA